MCVHVFLQPLVDFGMGSRTRAPEKRTVVVKNRSNAKMTVTWSIPDSYDGDDDKDWAVGWGVTAGMVLTVWRDVPAVVRVCLCVR